MNPSSFETCPRSSGRRRFLRAGLAATALAGSGPACRAAVPALSADRDAARSSHFPFGPVVPARAVPAWPVRTHDGRRTGLAALLQGRTTALQLMFTGCSATCPIQGALFAQAQRETGVEPARHQFVSLSIDPLADTPSALAAWLQQFSALPGWLAASPRPEDVDSVFDVLGRGGESRPGGSDRHTGQVYLVDRRGELVYRTASMPAPAQIVAALRRVEGQG